MQVRARVRSLAELAIVSCERLELLIGAPRLRLLLHAPCPLAGLGPASLAL